MTCPRRGGHFGLNEFDPRGYLAIAWTAYNCERGPVTWWRCVDRARDLRSGRLAQSGPIRVLEASTQRDRGGTAFASCTSAKLHTPLTAQRAAPLSRGKDGLRQLGR